MSFLKQTRINYYLINLILVIEIRRVGSDFLMRILFLTAHLPYPPFSGGRRREFELISRLSKRFEIDLCSVTKTWETDRRYVDIMRGYCSSVNLFKAGPSDMEQYENYSSQMRKHLSQEASSHIHRSLANDDVDVVHVEGYYLMQLLPLETQPPILLVEHNIEYLLNLQRMMLATSFQEISRCWHEYVYTLKWERIYWKRASNLRYAYRRGQKCDEEIGALYSHQNDTRRC